MCQLPPIQKALGLLYRRHVYIYIYYKQASSPRGLIFSN